MGHITFIHGIRNKTGKRTLHNIWKHALASGNPGINLDQHNITSDMVYWADTIYENPLTKSKYLKEQESEGIEWIPEDVLNNVQSFAEPGTPENQPDSAWIDKVGIELGKEFRFLGGPESFARSEQGTIAQLISLLPHSRGLKRWLARYFFRDAYLYLYNVKHSPRSGVEYYIRDEIRNRFVTAIQKRQTASRPHIVVSHSMGTVIAYDCLKSVDACPSVDALVTLGSPLGIRAVQAELENYSRRNGYPVGKIEKKWHNIYDPKDLVSRLDVGLADDFKKRGRKMIKDTRQYNPGLWTHRSTKYLKGPKVGATLNKLLGL